MMDEKKEIFYRFFAYFESDELAAYGMDLVNILPYSAWEHMVKALRCGEIINNMFSVKKLQEKYPKPKQRDCIRLAILLYHLDDNKCALANWVRKNKVHHDIKQGLKDYIGNLIDGHDDNEDYFLLELEYYLMQY